MSRGRHCEWVDLGEPYGMVFAQLTKPRSAFSDAEWDKLVAGLREFNKAIERRPAQVVCKGQTGDPHTPTRVSLRARPGDEFVGAVYECDVCRYDVHVDCELSEIAPNAVMLDLHHLAQLVTARRQALG